MPWMRNLLFLIVLALGGALLAQVLLADPGVVLMRFRGMDYTTTVARVMFVAVLLGAGAWLVWTLAMLPLRRWRDHRQTRAQARLADGLEALDHGHYARAEDLLAQAADDDPLHAGARVAAARAALARGDRTAAQRQIDALGPDHGVARALAQAERALADGRPTDALVALDAPQAQPLPPRGLALRAQALAVSGQAAQAYGLLGTLRQQQALPASDLERLQAQWAADSLLQADDGNVLAERWDGLSKPLRVEPDVVAAYARRAAALHWDAAATAAVEQALDARWDEPLAVLYGELPVDRLAARREQAERWLQAHPASAAVRLTLARLARAQGQWPQAEDHLRHALAQGAGADAWEELGHGLAAAGDDRSARQAYANALRARRGQPLLEPDGDPLRAPDDVVVIEDRDARGTPSLLG